MPHAGGGGGSGGGGFHSGSSGHSSAPRYDHHGNLHSAHYIRPGYYYQGIYVPLSRRSRRSIIFAPIGLILFGIFIAIMMIGSLADKSYSEEKLEDYSIDAYEEIYDDSLSTYEENLLITIVAYENNQEYDYITIVGDDVDNFTDSMFGNDLTTFGKLVLKNVDNTNYYSDLYENLSKAVNTITLEYSKKYANTPNQCQIVNQTSFGEISGYDDLMESLNTFYQTTGYSISVLVTDNTIAYTVSTDDLFPIIGIVATIIIGGICFLIGQVQAYKKINQAEKDGKLKDYYEGEDTYEEYIGKHSDNNQNNQDNQKQDDDQYNWKDDF